MSIKHCFATRTCCQAIDQKTWWPPHRYSWSSGYQTLIPLYWSDARATLLSASICSKDTYNHSNIPIDGAFRYLFQRPYFLKMLDCCLEDCSLETGLQPNLVSHAQERQEVRSTHIFVIIQKPGRLAWHTPQKEDGEHTIGHSVALPGQVLVKTERWNIFVQSKNEPTKCLDVWVPEVTISCLKVTDLPKASFC
jgi:hypothetical protein